MTDLTRLPIRYGRLRLDGDLDEFHHALNALQADTCDRGRCDGDVVCTRHQRREERRRLRAVNGTGQEGGGA